MSRIAAQGILIVGGSGVVGRRIAAELAPDYGDHVIVAGLNPDRAKIAATEIGREVDEPGAWMPEQVIDPERFFSRLATLGLHVDLVPVGLCLA
jgi:NAD(P)-dependent dehydrogenase (short-subunit alcohol dehydrogenase family)